jgi:hypothetical protein
MQLSFIGQSTSPPQGSGSSGATIIIAPAADFFVIDNLSVGGQLLFESLSSSIPNSPTITGWGIGPRVGYDIAFADNFSIWPSVYFQYRSLSISNNGGSTSLGTLGLFAPVLFHPVPHFFLGLGPIVQTDLISNSSPGGGGPSATGNKTTEYGVQFTLGGWILGG